MKNQIYDLKQYFVDETGNPEIFDKNGNLIIGEPGCSRFFMLGFLDVNDPATLRNEMRILHQKIINDPYFKTIPSMQLKERKTALGFHAKDDLPEIRREVFQLIMSNHDLRFVAVVKDKTKVAKYAIERRKTEPFYRYNPNELYDLLTRRIFKNYLHLAKEYKIYYAVRGEKPRTEAFGNCLKSAQTKFMSEHKLQKAAIVSILPSKPIKEPCLQVTDYFLWALQRLFEKREIRYLEYLKSKFDLIIDIDDTTKRKYGEYYDNKKNPIDLERITIAHDLLNEKPEI